jgi:cell division protein FtsX
MSSPTATTHSRPLASALAAVRAHPASSALAVTVTATSLLAVGTFALALEQAAMLERWYRDHLPGPGRGGLPADLLTLLGWGRLVLVIAAAGALLTVVVAGLVGMRMATDPRREEVRAAEGAAGAGRVRRSLLAQAALTGLAGALLAAAVLAAGLRLALRAGELRAALAGMPVVGAGELLAVGAAMAVAGVLACGLGGLAAQRALAGD